MGVCLKCGGTGLMWDGTPCTCGAGASNMELPVILDIPEQYQSVYFDKSFLPSGLHESYGSVLQGIISEVSVNKSYSKNVLICAPSNSGKTVFAYTLYKIFYKNGLPFSDVYDLNEVKKLMTDIYTKDDKYNLLLESRLAVVKIPLDLPSKFVETMLTILDLRLRHSGKTIFLFDGSKEDLLAQDKYNRLEDVLGDGSYHTIQCFSYTRKKKDMEESVI